MLLEKLADYSQFRKRGTKVMGIYHYFCYNQPFIIGISVLLVTHVKSIIKSLYLKEVSIGMKIGFK